MLAAFVTTAQDLWNSVLATQSLDTSWAACQHPGAGLNMRDLPPERAAISSAMSAKAALSPSSWRSFPRSRTGRRPVGVYKPYQMPTSRADEGAVVIKDAYFGRFRTVRTRCARTSAEGAN